MNLLNIEKIDLNLLKVFEALYEEGSASKAALRLGVTQSAVSAALARLRHVYSDHLFYRTGRGLKPSRQSDELKPIISDALNKFRQSLSLANGEDNRLQHRTLTLGWSDDYEIALGRLLIDRVASRFPGIRLVLKQTHRKIAADMLMNRAVDIVVTTGGFLSNALQSELVGNGRYACLIDEKGSAAASMTLEEYVARKHILISAGGLIGIVDEELAKLHMKRAIEASTTHFSAIPYLLKGSSAVVTLPAHAAHVLAETFDLPFIACPLALPTYPIELAWRHDGLRDPAIVGVKSVLRELISTMRHAGMETERRPD